MFANHILVLAALALAVPSSVPAQKTMDNSEFTFTRRIPLGVEGFFIRPAHRTLYVMSTASSPLFSGWRKIGEGPHRVVLAPDGSAVRRFPARIQFRVTASALAGTALDVDRDFLDRNDDLSQFLLKLGFRLKIFHGLEVTTVEPDSVEMMGVPADLPYDERIYRASFILPPTPIDDRIVLEVLTPEGDRLCKFHLEF